MVRLLEGVGDRTKGDVSIAPVAGCANIGGLKIGEEEQPFRFRAVFLLQFLFFLPGY
jgi:hypothetical protein